MYTGRVDKDDLRSRFGLCFCLSLCLFFADVNDTEYSVARSLRLGADDGELFTREFVEQCRFPRVGATKNADESRTKCHRSGRLHLLGMANGNAHTFDMPF